jgi:hypothetical protein
MDVILMFLLLITLMFLLKYWYLYFILRINMVESCSIEQEALKPKGVWVGGE